VFDFAVEYCPDHMNMVADALSRRNMEGDAMPHTVHIISRPTFAFIEAIHSATATAANAAHLRHQLHAGE